MAFKTVQTLDADSAVTIGGVDKKTKKANPTKIEGYYLGSRETEGGKFGPSVLHFLQTSKGNVGVWGKTDLNRKLASAARGEMVRITYKGTKPTPNGDMHTYLVEADAENTIDVSSFSSGDSMQSDGSANDEESYVEESYDGAEADVEAEEEAADDDEPSAAELQAAAEAQKARKAKVDAILNKGNKKKAV